MVFFWNCSTEFGPKQIKLLHSGSFGTNRTPSLCVKERIELLRIATILHVNRSSSIRSK